MRTLLGIAVGVAGLGLLAVDDDEPQRGPAAAHSMSPPMAAPMAPPITAGALRSVGRRPAALAQTRFVENRGQWDDAVRFAVLGRSVGWLHDDGFTVRFARELPNAAADDPIQRDAPRPRTLTGAIVRTRFSGRARATDAGAVVAGKLHFLRGREPGGHHTNVPTFAGATLRGVQPGIDVVFRSVPESEFAFAYDLALAPGADLAAFEATCDGADQLFVDRDGRLHVCTTTPHGPVELTQEPPVAWQTTANGRRPLTVEFEVRGPRTYGFCAPELDPALATVVDPGVAWSSYLGGGATDRIQDVAWQPGVGIWLAGWAGSVDFPTTVGAFQTTGERDAFLAKIDEAGTTLQFATYFGGSEGEEARAIALGPGQSPTIVGFTASSDLPITPGAYQATFGGAGPIVPIGDAFVTRLSAAGDAVLASTYLGGFVDEAAEGVAVDSAGTIYVVGATSSPDLPTTPGSWQPALGGPVTGQNDGFVAKFAADLTSATYVTYVGGTLQDQLLDVAIDPATGEAAAVGWSIAANFPTTPFAYRTSSAGSVEMVALRLTSDGSTAVFSSYLGGINEEAATGCALGDDGSLWLCGWTDSVNYPISAGAPQSTPAGEEDGVLTRLSADGSALLFSTYVAGTDFDHARDVAVDGDEVVVVGEAGPGLPLTPTAHQGSFAGGTLDAFLCYYTNQGAVLEYATYAGGSGSDAFGAVEIDNGLIVAGGWSYAADFPVTTGALQGQLLGVEDGVVMVVDLLTDLAGGLQVGSGSGAGDRRLAEAGEYELLASVVTNTTSRRLAIEGVRVLFAGSGAAPQQVSDLRVYLDDPALSGERDMLVAGPVAVVLDDAELEVALQGAELLPGGTATLRFVVDFEPALAGGAVEVACATVDPSAWTLRAFGAGAGPVVNVVGNGRSTGPVLVAGGLPGDVDGDLEWSVLDLRGLCSALGSAAGLLDTDGDQVITLSDVDNVCDGALGRAAVAIVPASGVAGEWLTLRGVFPTGVTVEAVLGGRALTLGRVTPRELTVRVDPALPPGPHDLLLTIGGRTLAAQSLIVQ